MFGLRVSIKKELRSQADSAHFCFYRRAHSLSGSDISVGDVYLGAQSFRTGIKSIFEKL